MRNDVYVSFKNLTVGHLQFFVCPQPMTHV